MCVRTKWGTCNCYLLLSSHRDRLRWMSWRGRGTPRGLPGCRAESCSGSGLPSWPPRAEASPEVSQAPPQNWHTGLCLESALTAARYSQDLHPSCKDAVLCARPCHILLGLNPMLPSQWHGVHDKGMHAMYCTGTTTVFRGSRAAWVVVVRCSIIVTSMCRRRQAVRRYTRRICPRRRQY